MKENENAFHAAAVFRQKSGFSSHCRLLAGAETARINPKALGLRQLYRFTHPTGMDHCARLELLNNQPEMLPFVSY
ncbi:MULTISPECIES: hypothetical protein [Yersiniaceae]|uniref:Uncharacterized protein n=1 Tax=Nissabacter archeti TaxID=1917880 RepID=A0ABS5JJB8_9GAMM|nr:MULTISPECIES: hypothetical protein [Yersiniaceae]MBS0970045.1 hypothetical protein [Nissabacter archeti]MDV5140079.1 hypothetical protein [Chimaeribacter arupi]WKZ90906.1 hypothetical protein P0E69_11620 [Chimaeribacter arupi]